MDLNLDLFTIEKAYQVPALGKVLISEPFLQDPYFKRTVVFLTEYNKEGSVGFVLNKPIDMPFSEIVTDFPDLNAQVSIGGPVGTNTMHFLHTMGDIIPQSVKILDGIYWGGDFEVIKSLVMAGKLTKKDIRFFLGYSGWQGEQLEDELAENSWLVADTSARLIMNNQKGHDIWKESLKNIGGKYEMWANFPENPSMN